MLLKGFTFSFLLISFSYSTIANDTFDEYNLCEEQLTRYRTFILTTILNFDDLCDIYESTENLFGHDLRHGYYQKDRASGWNFLKLLMAQLNDIEFSNVVKDAVVDKCAKASRSEKRDGVIIGKKQRFHSWGGKRSTNIRQHIDGGSLRPGSETPFLSWSETK